MALGQVVDDFSLVRFVPLNITKEESLEEIILQIGNTIQYGEDDDVRTKDFEYPDEDQEETENVRELEKFFRIES